MNSNGKDTRTSSSALFVLRDASARDVARALIEGRQNESFYVFDLDAAYESVCKFRKNLPRVQIFFAMKANDDEILLKLLITLGTGFDCASPGEINKIKMMNVCPTSIIYAMPMKSPEQMVFARESGVRHTTFDSSCELNKLKCHWPDARLLIRIKLESDSIYKLGEKFGCDFDEAFNLLEEAADLGLKVIGVAFHVGSVCFSNDSYMMGLRQARELFDYEISKGRGMKILDIGGGFFDCQTGRFDQVTDLITRGLDELFPEPDIQVVAEPGRYLCEPAVTLYSEINNVRTVSRDNKTVQNLYINNGQNDILRFMEKWYSINLFKGSKVAMANDKLQNTMIWGPTADERDHMDNLCQLPPCSPSDWLEFRSQGSYCQNFRTYLSQDVSTRYVITAQLWDQIKDNPIFRCCDVIVDPDFSTLLPLNLPPLLSDNINKYSNWPLLEGSN